LDLDPLVGFGSFLTTGETEDYWPFHGPPDCEDAVLTGREIKKRGLIENDCENSYRTSSYDLRIAHVIKPDGSLVDTYMVPAQGIVEVVSEERVIVPNDVAGIAMVKTTLCNEGLLPLNIGIVDPGYHGKLASFLVNFGHHKRPLSKGDVFLRLTFHQLEGDVLKIDSKEEDDAAYLAAKRKNIQLNFSDTFLNIGTVTKEFAKEAFEQYRSKAFTYVTIAAFLLAFMTFGLNFGNLLLVQRFVQPNDMTKSELLKESLDRRNKEIVELTNRLSTHVEQLERTLATRTEQFEQASKRIDELEKASHSQIAPSTNSSRSRR
jgi:deoxycytidine triphosphate deaminase